MAIPEYQPMTLPIPDILKGERRYQLVDQREVCAVLNELKLKQPQELLTSGTKRLFDNRIGPLKIYYPTIEELISLKRRFIKISVCGKKAINENLEIVNDSS